MSIMWPKVQYAVRYPVVGGGYIFDHAYLPGPGGSIGNYVEYPPAVGDLVALYENYDRRPLDGGPVFRVVERAWTYPAYGSQGWPLGQQSPVEGPLLEIMTEPSDGMYRGEVTEPKAKL